MKVKLNPMKGESVMAKKKVSKADFKKALEIGRPPNIKRLFPNSRALIVSGKVDRLERKAETEKLISLIIKLIIVIFLSLLAILILIYGIIAQKPPEQILPPILILVLIMIRFVERREHHGQTQSFQSRI